MQTHWKIADDGVKRDLITAMVQTSYNAARSRKANHANLKLPPSSPQPQINWRLISSIQT
eukprot:1157750-Pelagomonas_calceolata.AAC.13